MLTDYPCLLSAVRAVRALDALPFLPFTRFFSILSSFLGGEIEFTPRLPKKPSREPLKSLEASDVWLGVRFSDCILLVANAF